MKNIVIIYGGDDWNEETPFKKNPATRAGFEDLYTRAQKFNLKYYRASITWFDESRFVFKKAWEFDGHKWQKINNAIKPQGIFDKVSGSLGHEYYDLKMRIARRVPMVNHPQFKTIIDNKLTQYLLFQQFMPRSVLITGREQLKRFLQIEKDKRLVMKPLYGSGGKGIFIGDKAKLLKNRINYPILAQKYIKSTKGIPGFSQGRTVADLRLKYINRKFIFALSRIAKKDSLFTNFHQGATAIMVPRNKIPASVVKMAGRIIEMLSAFTNIEYSLDFMFTDSGRPILIEMNTTPGYDLLNIIGTEKLKDRNVKEIAKMF